MIKVEHLKKTYIGKHKHKSRGLVDVSFVLPSTGFVFVLGKSGSGKSTLLNILGSLDNKDEGKIYIDNKDFDKFTKLELSLYRSTYCGFIFQDYQLINELTVKENIKLNLEIINDTNDIENRVNDIIKKVDLEQFSDKNIAELSGGQKQRVSIARALIKNPKIILCDEPTGNLDSLNSTLILNLLKEISKNCLVFMVSHDEQSSLIYADRRIILEDGKIIKDEYRDEKYSNEFKIIDDVAYLPFGRNLLLNERDLLNKELHNNKIDKIKQIDDGFIPFYNNDDKKEAGNNIEFNNVNIEKSTKLKLTKLYFSKGKVFSICNTILFSLLTILILLIQTLLSFDSNKVFLDNFNNNEREQFIISKINEEGNDNNGTYLKFNESDNDNLFSNTKVKKYDVTNFALSFISGINNELEGGNVLTRKHYFNQHQVYVGGTCGTAIVDEQFLLDKYKNENGELEILAGSLSNCTSSLSLVITDYIADSIIDSFIEVDNSVTYDKLIGKIKMYDKDHYCFSNLYSGEVGCIIKTDYKEKYKDVFSKYENIKNNDFQLSEIYSLVNSENFTKYRNDVINGEINLGYSLNPNFLNDLKENVADTRNFAALYGLFASTCNDIVDTSFQYDWGHFILNNTLKDGEIMVSKSRNNDYMNLFNSKNFIGKDLFFVKTDGNTSKGKVLNSFSLKIVGTNDYNTIINENSLKKFISSLIFKFGYLIPKSEESNQILANALNSSLTIIDSNSEIYTLVAKTTKVFGDLFVILETIVIVLVIVYFLIYSIKSIKDYSYQIGVFKSLGMKDKDTTFIFLSKNVIFALLSLILTSLLSYPFFKLANILIIKAYSAFTSYILSSINIFYFHFDIFLITYIGIILFFVLFTLIPLFIYKRISPAKIVNNKSE